MTRRMVELRPEAWNLRGLWSADVFVGCVPLIKLFLVLQLATLVIVCLR